MTVFYDATIKRKPVKVNWINESIFGALLSAAFTILAAFAGTKGVAPDGFVAQWHEYMIWGGMAMSGLCCAVALVLFLIKITRAALEPLKEIGAGMTAPLGKGSAPHFAKFVKIFIP